MMTAKKATKGIQSAQNFRPSTSSLDCTINFFVNVFEQSDVSKKFVVE